MPLFPISIPPGVYRNGTEYQAKGRYFDAWLVRWYGSALGPIKGSRSRGSGTVTGSARAALAWKDNTNVTWLGIGTHSHLYVSNRNGDIFDITPVGFSVGRSSAVAGGGYGIGAYGVGTYGTPRPDNTLIQDATQCTLDAWGENLLFVSPDDGKIYEWALNTGTKAAAVSNAPLCKSLVVTEEGFLFALSTDDPRTVSWSDRRDNTVWTPDATNEAGSYPLKTYGRIMCGRVVKGGTLLLTDVDAHLATYDGGTFVYGFNKLADGCGVVSRQAVCVFDMKALWLSKSGFWMYNGYVQPVNCEVLDYVMRDINLTQISKTYMSLNSTYNEIEIRYCSSESTEIDRCVVWNYLRDHWIIGRENRLCGVDAGVFTYPIMIDVNGTIYDHECGYLYSAAPYAISGPVEIGRGDNVVRVRQLIPDDETLGDVTATFYPKIWPDDADMEFGPYTLASQTHIRFTGRQAKVRFDGAVAGDWRVGSPRLEGVLGGTR